MALSDEGIKHLEFIQNIITRMNTNSFQIKNWTITIVAALMAIFASTKNNYFIAAGLFPVLTFWLLDAYYLQQERKFRGLYNDVAGVSRKPQNLKTFEMRPDLYTGGKYSYLYVFFSKTILKMYLPLFVLLAGLFVFFEYFQTQGG